MIRVLVVDDHPIVRSGVSGLLATEPDFEVTGEASSGEEALDMLRESAVDVVLMDLRMPGMGGVEATRQIVRGAVGSGSGSAGIPGAGVALGSATRDGQPPRVLVFTTYEDDDQILAAIEAGASGYLVKAAPAGELAAGVRAVAAGQMVLAPSVAAQIVSRAVSSEGASDESGQSSRPDSAMDTRPRLTQRETEIVRLVREGYSNPAIAQRLYIGESTVKTHLLHVFEKLEVSDRTRAVIRAMELGLLD